MASVKAISPSCPLFRGSTAALTLPALPAFPVPVHGTPVTSGHWECRTRAQICAVMFADRSFSSCASCVCDCSTDPSFCYLSSLLYITPSQIINLVEQSFRCKLESFLAWMGPLHHESPALGPYSRTTAFPQVEEVTLGLSSDLEQVA